MTLNNTHYGYRDSVDLSPGERRERIIELLARGALIEHDISVPPKNILIIPGRYSESPWDIFDECQKTLPAYGTNQTVSVRMPPRVHWTLLMMQKDEGKGFYLIDTFPLPPEMCRPRRAAYKRKPRPPKPTPPPPPTIQDLLRKAFVYKKRLRENPALTREALAQEEGMDLVQMGKILSLLTLTPTTQQVILAMRKEEIASTERKFWELLEKREKTSW